MVVAAILVVLALTVAALRGMGRVWGEPRLWTSSANSPSTSQRLADPYTLTHVLHGILFYWAQSRLPFAVGTKLAVATLAEAAWEVLENTPAVINRYRAETASLGYEGDSVLNTLGDVLAAMLGFWMAHVLPWHASAAFVLLAELGLLWAIRDSLALNLLQLVWPLPAVREWQRGGAVTQTWQTSTSTPSPSA